MKENALLTDAQLRAEIDRCVYCEDKPCKKACPAACSPADFIMAARQGQPSDYRRAAGAILSHNPLGGVCGVVCTEKHCQSGCSRRDFDRPVNIPAIQATIIAKAKALGAMPDFTPPAPRDKRVAVVGAGPAGLATAAMLGLRGYAVTILEATDERGGACNQIPDYRLARDIMASDTEYVMGLGAITIETGRAVKDPNALLADGFESVVVTTGLPVSLGLRLPHEERTVSATDYLQHPEAHPCDGVVAVIGGGATAADAAVTAKVRGARHVEMFALEVLGEMPLFLAERELLLAHKIDVQGRVRVTEYLVENGKVVGLGLIKVRLAEGKEFNLADIADLAGTGYVRRGFDQVIVAIGNRAGAKATERPGVFYAGDCAHGPSSVVEAVSAGKAAALRVEAFLGEAEPPVFEDPRRCDAALPGFAARPVSLETDFFGRKIETPFLLSAAPPTDGYDQMKKAYEAGWTGGIMKTSFAQGPIHIPNRYMNRFNPLTFGNCDNVSGHLLDRVCREIERLVAEFPDRLTIGSTGGPVTGNDESDRRGWQGNTKRLEDAGASAIEYSLSCPQGGDGTEGDIVSQNPALTAKIVDWVMEVSAPGVPKLFKLTGAVTSVAVVVAAIKEVLSRYPKKKAGVTLANTFPTLTFKAGAKKGWDEGVIVGMSGEAVTPISYLTLAKVAHLGVAVSGNGGPMDYRAAADFLALGAETVQFCTLAMKYGYGILDEICAGVSHLMAARGMKSMKDLIGAALPEPVTDFMALSAVKQISNPDKDFCRQCGNCKRCPYLAISVNEEGYPVTDPERCIGCSFCSLQCFAGAIAMRDRTPEEAAALRE